MPPLARCRSTSAASIAAPAVSSDTDGSSSSHSRRSASTSLASASRLKVEVFDENDLVKMGCGGLLGVNAGSKEPPRMIKLRYRPKGASTHLALVGKGVMYDSGGISLKPTHAMLAMKMDMAGAGAICSAMTALDALGCKTAVTGYLMCTDNMPSGTATRLGDVLTIRGGKTVEVINADAEGRLVLPGSGVPEPGAKPKKKAVSPVVDVRHFRINGLALTFGGNETELAVRDVHLDGALSYDHGVGRLSIEEGRAYLIHRRTTVESAGPRSMSCRSTTCVPVAMSMGSTHPARMRFSALGCDGMKPFATHKP